MKIYFGIGVPVKGHKIDHFDMDKREFIYTPCIWKKDLYFGLCDICGTQVPVGRVKRGITTCSPRCNTLKWNRIKEHERTEKGVRPIFWDTFKFECFLRDNYTCQNPKCKSKMLLECHHIVPVILGGSNELSNLITLCHDCHSKSHPKGYRKTAKSIRENRQLTEVVKTSGGDDDTKI